MVRTVLDTSQPHRGMLAQDTDPPAGAQPAEDPVFFYPYFVVHV